MTDIIASKRPKLRIVVPEWEVWYAWFPVKTISGKYIWLKYILRKPNAFKGVDYKC